MDSLFDRPEHLPSSRGFTFFQKNPGNDLITQRRKLSQDSKQKQSSQNSNIPLYAQFSSIDGLNEDSFIEFHQSYQQISDNNLNEMTPKKLSIKKQAISKQKLASTPTSSTWTNQKRGDKSQVNSFYISDSSGSEDEGVSGRCSQQSSSLSASFQKLNISGAPSFPQQQESIISIPIPIKLGKPSIDVQSKGSLELNTNAQAIENSNSKLLLGDLCPLRALKKQFPIIFPVGIPIMGELSRFLNFGQDSLLEESINFDKPSVNIDSLLDEEWDYDKLCNGGPQPLNSSERRAKVEKFWEKKKARKWKSIRYNVRKNLAEQRERVSGRFVKQKNSRFNQENLDASYLRHLTLESDRMQLIEVNNAHDNSFEILNNSFCDS